MRIKSLGNKGDKKMADIKELKEWEVRTAAKREAVAPNEDLKASFVDVYDKMKIANELLKKARDSVKSAEYAVHPKAKNYEKWMDLMIKLGREISGSMGSAEKIIQKAQRTER